MSTVNVKEPVETIVFDVVEVVLYRSDSEFTIGLVGSVLSTDILVQATIDCIHAPPQV